MIGDKYPKVKSIRYPKAQSTNPNVTVYVVDLSVLKFINKIPIQSPIEGNNSYVTNMMWISATELSVTFTNREQTQAMTVSCRAPSFSCREIYSETVIESGWVLPADRPIFAKTENYFKHVINQTSSEEKTDSSDLNEFEFKSGGFMLKRLPVRDGEHGYYRHVVFISTSDMRTVPLTMGRFEVTEILGWDETNEIVYFMAAPESKPGQRQLYKIDLKLNITESPNRIYVTSSLPICLTCNANNLKLRKLNNSSNGNRNNAEIFSLIVGNSSDVNATLLITDETESETEEQKNPNNCLYNKIYFSHDFTYYVQECLGPDTPSIYLVETKTNTKVYALNNGDVLRNRISQLAIPQMRSFSVEIRHGFHAQVRLFLPPGMKEDEDIAFPMILQM